MQRARRPEEKLILPDPSRTRDRRTARGTGPEKKMRRRSFRMSKLPLVAA
ncbi:Hypothetical protein A7982_04509 [Minicystis rosea]|nr:Hypothetical protein A7982_04509 [Minicystis rosea]